MRECPVDRENSMDIESTIVPSISVIICAHTEDRWDDLVNAVQSVERQTFPALEIIVVIDHNRELFERVREDLSSVVGAENQEAKGLSGARNTGVSVAQGSVVAFLDDDATAAPDWLEWLADGYQDQRVFGVGGTITPVWPTERPEWFPEEFNWVVGCTFKGMAKNRQPVGRVIGANMSFRREVFQSLNGFRTDLGRIGNYLLSCEETEFCFRAHRTWSDKVLLFEPRAQVFHHVAERRVHRRYFISRSYAEGFSKARISRLFGAKDGLTLERSYTFRTLPRGILNGLADVFVRREPSGIIRAGMIVIGLTVTTAGFLVGVLESYKSPVKSLAERSGIRLRRSTRRQLR
jgi:glucosyl-dolichyl phosphate glucuronosyltransferase